MKRLALLLLLLSGPAWAQAPQILKSDARIEIGGIGESQTLRFPQPYKSFETVPKGVVNLLPQSDRQITLTGTEAGQALMYIYDDQDRVMYTATVSVLLGLGHSVKLYGSRRGSKDYVGYYCNDASCGRADLDKRSGGRDPDDPVATTVTQPLPGGGSVTRQYTPN